jgi:SAM-dependent methyltransferase
MTSRPIADEHVLPDNELRDLLLRYRLENWKGIQPPELQNDLVGQLMHCDPDALFSAVATYLRITRESRILDVGSGVGSFVAACRDRGLRCFGIEPDRIGNGGELTAVQIARRRVAEPAFTVGVGENLPFADRVFDLVTMNQVIEHVGNQGAVLAEAARVLADGGVLYLACPNYLCFYEPHYKILWFPLMPKMLGRLYLRLRGRRSVMLDQITYTTNRRIRKLLAALGQEFTVVDLHREQFLRKRRENSFAGRATRLVSRLTHFPVLGPVILQLVLWFGSVREAGCEWAVIRTSMR